MTEIVYHYTDTRGLLGIIETGSLWLTHSDFLNDMQEVRIGRILGLAMLAEVARGKHPIATPLSQRIARVALERIAIAERVPDPSTLYGGVFIASMTGLPDDLSQYRGYSSSNSRYCVGFKRSEITRLDSTSGLGFSHVNYNNVEVQALMLSRFLELSEERIQSHRASQYHPNDPENWHYPEIPNMVDSIMSIGSPLVKHKSFESEDEWRIYTEPGILPLYISANTPLFRPGINGPIPYISQSLADLDAPIVSITVGPAQSIGHAITAIKLLEKKRRIADDSQPMSNRLLSNDLKIDASEIPFRG